MFPLAHDHNDLYENPGEWQIGQEKKKVKGHIDVLEFSFGELDDLEVNTMSLLIFQLEMSSFCCDPGNLTQPGETCILLCRFK